MTIQFLKWCKNACICYQSRFRVGYSGSECFIIKNGKRPPLNYPLWENCMTVATKHKWLIAIATWNNGADHMTKVIYWDYCKFNLVFIIKWNESCAYTIDPSCHNYCCWYLLSLLANHEYQAYRLAFLKATHALVSPFIIHPFQQNFLLQSLLLLVCFAPNDIKRRDKDDASTEPRPNIT